MKFYLSSNSIPRPQTLIGLISKPADKARAVVVGNARDYKPLEVRRQKIAGVIGELKAFGFKNVSELDLRDFSRDEKGLSNRLQGADLLWFTGGNTFILRRLIRDSGLEMILPQLLDGGAVYGGESAGAIVAGLSLEGVDKMDDVTQVDDPPWEGLGLIDSVILPHADSPDYAAEIAEAVKLHRVARRPVKLIGEADDWAIE